MKCDIFISYRRSDGRDIARTIQQALLAKGYDNIFFDYSSLRDGVFNEQIIDAIECCKDYIVVLSRDSLSRCAIAGDWVAREMEAAISAGCHIIPVAIDVNYDMFPENLPDQLKAIENIQQTKLLTNEYFDDSINRLTQRLLSKPDKHKVDMDTCKLEVSIDETSLLYLNDNLYRKLKGGKKHVIDGLVKDETYKLRIENLSRKNEQIICSFTAGIETQMQFSFLCQREEAAKRQKQEKDHRRKEKEEERKKQLAIQTVLANYDAYWEFKHQGAHYIVSQKGKMGYVTNNGHELLPCIYDKVSDFVDGYACVMHGGVCDVIDENGNVRLHNISEDITVPLMGYLIVKKNSHYGLIDLDGKILLDCVFDKILYTSVKGLYVVKLGIRSWLHDVITNQQYGESYEDIVPDGRMTSRNLETGLMYEWPKDKYYFEEKNYTIRTFPLKVKSNGKYGVIGKNGKTIIPCTADGIEFLSENEYDERQKYAVINTRKKYGLVSIVTGEYSIPPAYDYLNNVYICNLESVLVAGVGNIQKEDLAESYSRLYTSKRDDVRFGIISKEGQEIVPIIYDELRIWGSDKDDIEFACFYHHPKRLEVFDITGKIIRKEKLE